MKQLNLKLAALLATICSVALFATTYYTPVATSDATGNLTTIKAGFDSVTTDMALKAPLISPSFTTPALGVATATSVTATGLIAAYNATAVPAGGTAGVGVTMSSTANLGIFFGSNTPTLSAAKGSLYLRTDGTTVNNRAYINTDGSTTWTALTTAG